MAPLCKSRTTAEPFSERRSGYTINWLAAEGRSDKGSLRIAVVNFFAVSQFVPHELLGIPNSPRVLNCDQQECLMQGSKVTKGVAP
jgi:hypothetical protein